MNSEMTSAPAVSVDQAELATRASMSKPIDVEAAVHEWGERIFGSLETTQPPSLFSSKGLQRSLMDWTMQD